MLEKIKSFIAESILFFGMLFSIVPAILASIGFVTILFLLFIVLISCCIISCWISPELEDKINAALDKVDS